MCVRSSGRLLREKLKGHRPSEKRSTNRTSRLGLWALCGDGQRRCCGRKGDRVGPGVPDGGTPLGDTGSQVPMDSARTGARNGKGKTHTDSG